MSRSIANISKMNILSKKAASKDDIIHKLHICIHKLHICISHTE